MEKWNSNLQELLKKDKVVVFDIDGTLLKYEFGDGIHTACNNNVWEQFVIENEPYKHVSGVQVFKEFINDKLAAGGAVYVCSRSEEYEKEQKKEAVLREYSNIPPENIIFVASKKDKLEAVRSIAKIRGVSENNMVIVDDSVDTLDYIYENSAIMTVHITTFM